MKSSFEGLRAVLVLIFCINLLGAYISIANPGFMLRFYPGVEEVDIMHRYLSLGLGIFLLAFAAGTVLSIISPLKYVGVVTMLILMHFFGFVADVLIIAEGTVLPLKFIIPEMIYLLFICTLLVRFYPAVDKRAELSDTANELVGAFRDQLKKKNKEESIAQKNEEKEREKMKKELKKEIKKEEKDS